MILRIVGFIGSVAMSGFASMANTVEKDSLETQILNEVVVMGNASARRVANMQLGAERLEMAVLEKAPVLFGEVDIMKSITLLPGIRQESEGWGGYMVRGGTASQNLVQLDGASIYNPSHVMGIFSTFNDDAIAGATLYKGLMPSWYGGATSSVLDIQLAPGNMEHWHASGTIGLLAAKVNVNGPIIKEKLSLAVSGRRSYADMFLKMVPKYRSTVMHFYDINAKLRYRLRPEDYIDASFSMSHDNMGISDIMWIDWGNTAASVKWMATRGGRLQFITTGSWTAYTADMWMDIMNNRQRLDEYIRTISLNERVLYSIDDHQEIEAGFRSELLRVKSGEWSVNTTREKDIRSGWGNDIWLSYKGDLTNRFSLQSGVRMNLFSALTGPTFKRLEDFYTPVDMTIQRNGIAKTYFNVEPRLSLNPIVLVP